MSAVVLSSDELRVASHLAGVPTLAPDPGWAAEDLPVADVVATRSLLARGLLDLAPEATLAPVLTILLAQPGPAVSVRRDTATGTCRSTMLGCMLADERSPDIWHLSAAADRRTLIDRLAGGVPDDGAAGTPVRLPAAALTAAQRMATSAQEGAVADHLRSGDLGREDARALARVLARRQATTTVRIDHHAGTRRTTAALTWLETGADVWLAVPESTTGPDDPPGSELTGPLPLPDELDEVLRLEPVTRAGLRTALTELLAELEAPR